LPDDAPAFRVTVAALLPVAVLVDLDRVRSGPPRLVRAGIGDVVNNLSAIADWELAAADRGEPVDGLAVTMARTAAQAVLHQPGTIGDDEFLTVLAESLVLSGMAMTVAGSSRPASGGCHEILYAIDQLYPGTGNHGELAGVLLLARLFDLAAVGCIFLASAWALGMVSGVFNLIAAAGAVDHEEGDVVIARGDHRGDQAALTMADQADLLCPHEGSKTYGDIGRVASVRQNVGSVERHAILFSQIEPYDVGMVYTET
jgi:hypothetical protein